MSVTITRVCATPRDEPSFTYHLSFKPLKTKHSFKDPAWQLCDENNFDMFQSRITSQVLQDCTP